MALVLAATLQLALTLTAAAAPRAALLDLISPLKAGFDASREQRESVKSAIEALARAAPQQTVPDISGDWELIYTDAPDILGLDAQAGPFLTCTKIGQQISESDMTIQNVIEYGPREWASSVVGQVKNDRIQQRVVTTFSRRTDAPTKVDLKIKGAAFVPKQFFGVSLDAAPPLKLQGFVEPPFGSFEVLYCEEATNDAPESIRVVRTTQGYYSINKRLAVDDGWGEV